MSIRMRVLAVAVLLCTCASLVSACASAPARTPASFVDRSQRVFLITEAQADRVLIEAMITEFGNDPISKIDLPNKGYRATIKFWVDSHEIFAYMVPSRGVSPSGNVLNGYYFTVTHSGTMPLSGIARSKRLRERLAAGASAISPAVLPAP